jgi:2-polyprenyl-3-methyl-5-hydroxy-6-metoxy-1,4-benzoquinol methylase
MKPLDRLLQRWRIRMARPWIPEGARVLDIGSGDGELFRRLADRVSGGVGIDPDLAAPIEFDRVRLLPGSFPAALAGEPAFDAITMLAVLEHVPPGEQPAFAAALARHLRPGGVVVLTTPSPLVDRILDVLLFLRLADGMALHEHYGFEPSDTPRVLGGAGLRLVHRRRFQLGLNYLFVFRREAGA